MNRPTLGTLRNSAFGNRLGICAGNIAEIASRVNEAQERLLTDPLAPDTGWFGGWAHMTFNVLRDSSNRGYITAPREVARLTDAAVCRMPVFIRNGFYEFMSFGAGLQEGQTCCVERCGASQMYERDSVSTQAEFTGPVTLRLRLLSETDNAARVMVQGTDGNGMPVSSLDSHTGKAVSGENVYLASPFVDTVNQFATVTGILKPATRDMVQIYAVNADLSETLICTMEPNETTAYYRRYMLSELPGSCIGGTAGTVQVSGMAKLDLVPVLSDPDYLLIQSIPALIEECQAIRYGNLDSSSASKKHDEHHARALRLLFGQLDHYLGKTSVAVSVPIFGSARLRPQPR